MASKTLNVPKAALKAWGDPTGSSLNAMSANLEQRGFIGPRSWSYLTYIPYTLDVVSSVQVDLGITRCGEVNGLSLFDAVATVWSKTIFLKTLPTDPWSPLQSPSDIWHEGHVPCLAIRLSHLKWAEAFATSNPSWRMTIEQNGLVEWLADFDRLLHPILRSLTGDDELDQVLMNVISYRKPMWVKSDGPGFANISQLLACLRR